jgi:pSer/pThr/pTyr-binding forkhead associated (FHA) protein
MLGVEKARFMKLTVVLNGRTLKRHEFDDGKKLIRIGRADDCEVPIDNLGISRVHCEVARRGRGLYMLRDLESGNGTFVNGNRVKTHNLNDGDTINLGKFALQFTVETEDLPASPKPLSGGGGGGDMGNMTMAIDPSALAKKHREQQSRNLGYLTSKEFGDVILKAPVCIFGTGREAKVKLTGWFCPRVVAVLIKEEAGFRIVDVSNKGHSVSINGIHKLNATLSDNDVIIVRGKTLTFHRGKPVGR